MIVGEGSALPKLLPYGKIVDRLIQELPNKYFGISVDTYVIMPNHIHLLLSVSKDNGRADPSPTINRVIGWLKFEVTKAVDNSFGEKIFQRSFYDHIIRNRDDYNGIFKYIYENPSRWKYDKLYSDNQCLEY